MSTYDDASLIYYPSGYKAGTAYSLKPTDGSGDLTFTRASTATRVNSSGLIESVATGVPRIDYTGGGCGKLLLEPQRTNLVIYSEEFNNWLIPPTFTAIETASLKDSIIFSNFGNAVSQGITLTSNADTTISVFAKKSNWNFLQIRTVNFDASASARTWFDLLNGTVGSTDIPSRHFNQSIEDFGGGWYRCSLTFKSITDLTGSIQLAGSQSNSSTISGANSGEDIFFDMSQVELGSYPTSYIPTTSTAVTRTQDSATKSGISSLIGQTEGVLFFEFDYKKAQINTSLFDTSLNNNDNIYLIALSDFNLRMWVTVGGVNQAIISTGTIPSEGRHKAAMAYKENDCAFYLDGVQVGVDTSCTIPTVDDLLLKTPNQNTQAFMTFPTRLSDDDLTLLTGTLGETYFESYALMANYLNYTVQ